MDWNEFNRQLQNRVSDPGTRYCLGIVYERLLDTVKQVDENNEILLQLVETMKDLIQVSASVDDRVKALRKQMSGQRDGVSVESEPLTNEE
jgi:hypothetical protein